MFVHRYDAPDRFVAGTVGEPGDRTFFLQAREGNRITSVACEKQQVSVLAEHLTRMLEEVARRGMSDVDPGATVGAHDTEPLDAPITEEFRVGTMTLAWEAVTERVVIEMFSATSDDVDPEAEGIDPDALAAVAEEVPVEATEPEASEVFVVRITPDDARNFISRAEAIVSAGRPPCPFCAQPLEPEGHICPRANGYRRPLF
ncbi:DUF3090 family protein [Propionibacteriaceae bacterium Y1685]|uniref:DUF3090 family protein n=1 Tax=Microlunatus sp. Y1700 TaxID=3418487 RepID=UPI003B7F38E6